jgi:hypothetical protein
MTTIVPFMRVVQGERFDITHLAFVSDAEIARILRTPAHDAAPTRVVVLVARWLLLMTQRDARAIGFADRETAHERGLRLLEIVVAEFPGKPGN